MAVINPSVEAKHYHRDGDVYVCDLCPHSCRIPVGGMGRCSARRGEEKIQAVLPEAPLPAVGETAWLSFPVSKTLVFDNNTGERIGGGEQ